MARSYSSNQLDVFEQRDQLFIHLFACVCSVRYTREAGVRSLERKIGAICRAVAVKVAEGHRLTKRDGSTPESPSQEGKTPRL